MGPTGFRAEGERGDDPEVATAAAQSPEEVRLGVGGRRTDGAVGADDLRLDEVVARQAVLGVEVAVAATEGEPGDAGLGHPAERGRQAEHLRLAVDVGEQGAALHPREPAHRVDLHAAHAGQVDEEAAPDGRQAGDGVAPAAHRDQQVSLARERDGIDDVAGPGAPRRDRCVVGVHRVPRGTRSAVGLGVGGGEHEAPEAGTQFRQDLARQPFLRAVEPFRGDRHRSTPCAEPESSPSS